MKGRLNDKNNPETTCTDTVKIHRFSALIWGLQALCSLWDNHSYFKPMCSSTPHRILSHHETLLVHGMQHFFQGLLCISWDCFCSWSISSKTSLQLKSSNVIFLNVEGKLSLPGHFDSSSPYSNTMQASRCYLCLPDITCHFCHELSLPAYLLLNPSFPQGSLISTTTWNFVSTISTHIDLFIYWMLDCITHFASQTPFISYFTYFMYVSLRTPYISWTEALSWGAMSGISAPRSVMRTSTYTLI